MVTDELDPRGLKIDTFGYLVEPLEREEFFRAMLGLFKTSNSFLRTSYSWSQVLNYGTKLSCWDFVNMLIAETLRAWDCFVIAVLWS